MSDRRIKVLLIEDNAGDVRLLHENLSEDKGALYDVVVAGRLSDGLTLLGKEALDIVLLDLGLPDSQGLDTLTRVIAKAPTTPIIVLTGLNDEAFGFSSIQLGAQDYLIKGHSESHLIARSIRYAIERKKIEVLLEDEKIRYKELFDSSRDAIFIMDLEGNFIDANPEAEKLSGYKIDDPQKPNVYSIVIEEDKVSTERKVKDVLTTGHTSENSTELRIKKKDGQPVWVESRGTLLFNTEGKPYAIQGIIRDITERKRMQKKLEEHDKHLAVINKILRHDILNDQAAINSALRLYQGNHDESFLKEISDRVSRTVRLINQMRDVETSLSFDNKLKLHDVADILRKVMEKHPSITFTIEGSCQALTDGAFDSAIDNIIRNAINHGKTDRIDVTVEDKNNFCEIRIADYGMGISNEIKTKIFAEGFKFGQYKGSGLGLYIVEKTIERYGGTVHVEDNTPQGAVFVLKLKKTR